MLYISLSHNLELYTGCIYFRDSDVVTCININSNTLYRQKKKLYKYLSHHLYIKKITIKDRNI